MAASELLPVQGVHSRGRAARDVPRPRRARGPGAVGEAGKRVHAPVRGDGRGAGQKPAGRGHRRAGRRT